MSVQSCLLVSPSAWVGVRCRPVSAPNLLQHLSGVQLAKTWTANASWFAWREPVIVQKQKQSLFLKVNSTKIFKSLLTIILIFVAIRWWFLDKSAVKEHFCKQVLYKHDIIIIILNHYSSDLATTGNKRRQSPSEPREPTGQHRTRFFSPQLGISLHSETMVSSLQR